jgi:uncharacterized membrane protein/uncharacterized protein (UPF0548 family)
MLHSSSRNFALLDGEAGPRWRRQLNEQVVALESAGRPEPGGAFQRAKSIIANYGFSDPRIVVGHFDENAPLEGRRILLEIKVLGLSFLCGVAVTQVFDSIDDHRSVFGFRYETLHPHLEAGYESFILTKDHRSGVIRFRIESLWKGGEFPNWWSRLGFRLLVRDYQSAWLSMCLLRLRDPLATEHLSGNKAALLAAGWGALAGMRSMLPISAASRSLKTESSHIMGNAAARHIARPATGKILSVLALAELIADKLPSIPNRTRPIALAGRVASAAVAAAAVSARRGRTGWGPPLIGAVCAVASSSASFRFRAWLSRRFQISSSLAGVVEDVVALSLAAFMMRASRHQTLQPRHELSEPRRSSAHFPASTASTHPARLGLTPPRATP